MRRKRLKGHNRSSWIDNLYRMRSSFTCGGFLSFASLSLDKSVLRHKSGIEGLSPCSLCTLHQGITKWTAAGVVILFPRLTNTLVPHSLVKKRRMRNTEKIWIYPEFGTFMWCQRVVAQRKISQNYNIYIPEKCSVDKWLTIRFSLSVNRNEEKLKRLWKW